MPTEQQRAIALGMIKRYGSVDAALEYASGYAYSLYFDQSEYGKAQWLAVCEALREYARANRGKQP